MTVVDQNYLVSIVTNAAEQSAGGGGSSFAVTVNGLPMSDPVRHPLLRDEIVVKQMTNYAIVVATDDFRLQFDLDAKIYLRLDARFANKVPYRTCRPAGHTQGHI